MRQKELGVHNRHAATVSFTLVISHLDIFIWLCHSDLVLY